MHKSILKSLRIIMQLLVIMTAALIIADRTKQSVSADDVKYDIWLGNTQVTEANKNDILGDGGKAKYDSENRTLILNDPTISGVYKRPNGNESTCKIFIGRRFYSVRISGTYDMKTADAVNGLYSETWINFTGGNLKFYGSDYGIRAATVSITGGQVYAEGGINGVYNSQNASGTTVLIYDQGVYTRAEFKGGTAAMGTKVSIENKNIFVTTPSNGIIDKNEKIYESDGRTLPKHVVIEQQYTVTFNANGHGSAPASQQVGFGEKVKKPVAPYADGYSFVGWYTDQNCTSAFSFDTGISTDTTLYAKWTKYEATSATRATNAPTAKETSAPATKATNTSTTKAASTQTEKATNTSTTKAASTSTEKETSASSTTVPSTKPVATETPDGSVTTPSVTPEESEVNAVATDNNAKEESGFNSSDTEKNGESLENVDENVGNAERYTESTDFETASTDKKSENRSGSHFLLLLLFLLLILSVVIYVIVRNAKKQDK